ncbi:MAG: hypothetical protein O7E54_05540 [Planctomycetota bacterium]|nr:hypothetical protein [Planctomycetota bacterium]
MRRRLAVAVLILALASAAGAFVIASNESGGRFIFEQVPSNRLPISFNVDTEGVTGVANPVGVTQELMNQWNLVPGAEDVFGSAIGTGPMNGGNVKQAFGVFTSGNRDREVAWDSDGGIMQAFFLDPNVLGITIKSVVPSSGNIVDVLVVVNTRPGFLDEPGATREEVFRGTLLHELGHAAGLGHTTVGMVNSTATSFGFMRATPARIPTMYPFRLPLDPEEGGTLEEDDRAALTSVYRGDTSGLGSVSGTVRHANGLPINEIAVRAVSEDGSNHVGRLTNHDNAGNGSYRIPHLPPGGYSVIIEAVNGRVGLDFNDLAPNGDGLGGNPFLYAADELWQAGDTFDPAVDVPGGFDIVQVRAGRDSGSIDFVLQGEPLSDGANVSRSLSVSDARIPNRLASFSYADYYVFHGTAGETATIRATTPTTFTPQLHLLRPSDLAVDAEDFPSAGIAAQIVRMLPETGIYTLIVSARSSAGSSGGGGSYDLSLSGNGSGPLPPPPVVRSESVAEGVNQPGNKQFASPVRRQSLMQIRLDAPSHEELWVERVIVRAFGSGNDALDVERAELVRDFNGNGERDAGEPVLASASYATDDGTLAFNGVGLEIDPGASTDLIVTYDVTVQSVSSAGPSGLWGLLLLPAAIALRRLRPRTRAVVVLLLLCAVTPLSCGGGGSSAFNQTFDPQGAVVTYGFDILQADIVAFTPTTDPNAPLLLPPTALSSATLTVSN